ncbi:MAG TPA: hypothetical protein VKT52_04555 [Ktedonobacterales bacterium]|nr:hypothetical protein [Ktedonobacterales bacterium]
MRDSWVLIIAAPPALVALAVWLDKRSRRGYGLGLLAAVALVLDIWGIIAFSQASQQVSASHTDNLDFALVEAVYMLIGLYFTLALVLGGIAETLIARHWRWFATIVTVSLVLALIVLAPGTALVPDVLGALGLSRGGEAVVLLLVPVLVIFAYALTRIFRPVAPRSPRGSQDIQAQLSR